MHYVKSVRIRSYSGPYFPAFGLNTERYGVSLRSPNAGKYGPELLAHAVLLAYKTLYGFRKLGAHNNFFGVHLYVVYAICRTITTLGKKTDLHQKMIDIMKNCNMPKVRR